MSNNTYSKVNQLRHRKVNDPPVEFTPSDAYIIMGHGTEPMKTFKVPPNCVIIVKYHPGELAWSDEMFPLFNKVGSPERNDIYKDPLNNIQEIINEVGSVIIYKPGDKCPNYSYALGWNEDNFIRDETGNHLGLIKAPLRSPLEVISNPGETTLQDIMTQVYDESILPTAEQVISEIHKILQMTPTATVNDAFERIMIVANLLRSCGKPIQGPESCSPFRKFLEKFTYTQKDLLDIDNSGNARRPGVYYNFVCRQKGKANLNQNYLNTIVSLKNANVMRQGLLKRKIIEAETKRKQLLRGTKYNRGGRRKTRKINK
jgi:hypothetical protein